MPVRAGQIYRRFLANDRETRVTLRAAKWEDLDGMGELANGLVAERQQDPNFGMLIGKPVTREEEAEWLANKLVRIELGREISVVAEADRKVVGNSEVSRGGMEDDYTHGKLGIAVEKSYRGIGIGNAMMWALVRLSREAGLKTLELEVLSTNPRAASLYQRIGFKPTGILKGKIRRGEKSIDAIVMTRDL